jgi:hypothetical protein
VLESERHASERREESSPDAPTGGDNRLVVAASLPRITLAIPTLVSIARAECTRASWPQTDRGQSRAQP